MLMNTDTPLEMTRKAVNIALERVKAGADIKTTFSQDAIIDIDISCIDTDHIVEPNILQSTISAGDQDVSPPICLNKNTMPNPRSSGGVEMLDPHGDLKLVVGEDKVVFQVCSRALACSSEAWETLLHGPCLEGKAQQDGQDWEIYLPDDDPDGLRIILNVIHQDLEAVPKVVSFELLFQLIELSDKYNMVASLKPFWRDWNRQHILRDFSGVDPAQLGHQIWVSNTLGDRYGYRKAIMAFVTRTATNDQGQLRLTGFENYNLYQDIYLESLEVLEPIRQARLAILEEICDRVKDGMDALISGSRCAFQHSCDCAMLGALHRAMASLGLEHWFSRKMEGVAQDTTLSATQLFARVKNIKTHTLLAARGHVKCSPWEQPENVEWFAALPEISRFIPDHDMTRQAAESGVDL
ncbi:hypothetical protein C8A00DRAFT_35716 [Chaetomidium leptoderma]|uniref:BTB domain-containing protein n=1 Tax=Chaetomidium leptoderma TaxID=669021 RepID=A0AAN6VHK3_9PEZI|nr:hypothetical protein C8A00DRAFT_35716 [Chaetomidium leptoderma]